MVAGINNSGYLEIVRVDFFFSLQTKNLGVSGNCLSLATLQGILVLNHVIYHKYIHL